MRRIRRADQNDERLQADRPGSGALLQHMQRRIRLLAAADIRTRD
jgi:hypothetical protein